MAAANHQTKIGIDVVRARQLRQIAADMNLPMSTIIDNFVRDQWAERDMRGLPGFSVKWFEAAFIIFKVDLGDQEILSAKDARRLARCFQLEGNGRTQRFVSEAGVQFSVARKGQGILLKANGPNSNWQRGMSFSIADDIRKMLIDATKNAAA